MPFSKRVSSRLAAILAITAAAAAAGLLQIAPDQPASPPTVTVAVDGLDPGKAPDRTIKVPKAAVEQVAAVVHDHLASEAAATPQALAQQAETARTLEPLPTAGATAGFAGCRTSFVRNQSSRRGIRPTVQTLHYTVSPNRPGWSDINAIVAFFDNPKSQASSHFVIDSEGHCAYIVPIESKAWTEAAGNPASVGYEIIAQGTEAVYLQPAGEAKLRQVAHEVARRTGIPLRRGQISSNCTVLRTGIVEHGDWGICGGGHTDIKPFSIDAETRKITGGDVAAADRTACRKLNAWRTAGRPRGGQWERNSIQRKAALTKRGVTCLKTGPVRR